MMNIEERQAEDQRWLSQELPKQVLIALKEYRDEKSGTYLYKGVPIKLTPDLTTIYFAVLLDQNIPDEQVMAAWQEDGYDTINITAGDLRMDGKAMIEHRQKWWTAFDVVKGGSYESIEDAIEAFDAAIAGLEA